MIYHCLMCGDHSKLVAKKVSKYLLGTREIVEIFKLYELRYLLLKSYPLIQTLFQNSRDVSKIKYKKFWKPSPILVPETPATAPETAPLLKDQGFSKPLVLPLKKKSPFKKKHFFVNKRRNLSPQILFASITPLFAPIISDAAQICNMPWHENRWLSGSITAAISYPNDKLVWQYLQDAMQKKVSQAFSKRWGINKENIEKTKEKTQYYGRSRWPSLLIIPDISNNSMILKEAQKVGLPIMGLINSKCQFEIEYPIFAQDQTLQSIHFFCHFLAILIAKETNHIQHKRYTLQKALSNAKKKKVLTDKEKVMFNLEPEVSTLEEIKNTQIMKEPWKKTFFFKIFGPWKRKSLKRYLFSTTVRKRRSKKYKWKQREFYYDVRKKKSDMCLSYRLADTNMKNKTNKLTKMTGKKKMYIFQKMKFLKPAFKKKNYWALLEFFWSQKKMAKGPFKPFEKNFNFSNKKTISITMEKKIVQEENRQKYFQKNRPMHQNIKHIYFKLRNFLWARSLFSLWRKRHYSFITYPVYGRKKYYGRRLEHLPQNTKWRNQKPLMKSLIKYTRHKIENILEFKVENKLFFRKFYRNFRKRYKPNPNYAHKKPWNLWVKKNKKVLKRNNYEFKQN